MLHSVAFEVVLMVFKIYIAYIILGFSYTVVLFGGHSVGYTVVLFVKSHQVLHLLLIHYLLE